MTGDHAVSPSTTQPPTQHRPASSECIVGQERGFRCLPVIPGSPWCAKHHPERQGENRQNAKLAARASHARRPDPALEAWADTLDFSTDEGRQRSLAETAQLVAKGGLSAAQGATIAALVRAAEGRPSKAPARPTVPLVVEVQRYGGQSGQESGS